MVSPHVGRGVNATGRNLLARPGLHRQIAHRIEVATHLTATKALHLLHRIGEARICRHISSSGLWPIRLKLVQRKLDVLGAKTLIERRHTVGGIANEV